MHFGIGFITFDHQLYELMYQRVQEEDPMEITKFPLPSQNGMFGNCEAASRGISAHAIDVCLDHGPDHTYGCFQTGHEGLFGLGEVAQAIFTLINDTTPMMLGGIGRMRGDVKRFAGGTLEL